MEEAEDAAPAPRAEAPAVAPRRAEPAPAPAVAPEESVASKLSRIRAVVDRARATSVPARPVAPPAPAAPVSAAPEAYLEDEEPPEEAPAEPTVAPRGEVAPENGTAAAEPVMSAEPASWTDDDDDEILDEDEAPRPWQAASDEMDEDEPEEAPARPVADTR